MFLLHVEQPNSSWLTSLLQSQVMNRDAFNLRVKLTYTRLTKGCDVINTLPRKLSISVLLVVTDGD